MNLVDVNIGNKQFILKIYILHEYRTELLFFVVEKWKEDLHSIPIQIFQHNMRAFFHYLSKQCLGQITRIYHIVSYILYSSVVLLYNIPLDYNEF